MEILTKHLPKGTLSLPKPPEGFHWIIENQIVEGKKRNKYFIEILLVKETPAVKKSFWKKTKPQKIEPVIKIKEQWDKKLESYTDFALGVTGLALLELDSYLGFKAINWHVDNPEIQIKLDTPTKTVWVK